MASVYSKNKTSRLISPKHWGKILACLLFLLCFFASYFLPISDRNSRVLAQSVIPCATPGKDGAGGTLSGIINTYYPSPGNASVSGGATSILVGSPSGNLTAIAPGDLLLIIQMQDAVIDSSNTDAYGDGIGGDVLNITSPQPSIAASGWTQTTAGTYEFVVAQSNVSSGSVTIRGVGGNNGLINNYVSSTASTTKGQSTYQVIRVPQYSSATLGNATALPWNGAIGGILTYDVTGNLDLTGNVNADARGFRGGAGRNLAGIGSATGYANTDFRTPATININGSKGEGIAGTPRYVLRTFDNSGNSLSRQVLNTSNEGYPNGSYGRGAPGNAGGGSTDGQPSTNAQNSGGGGGGNGGHGGRGGRSWSSQVTTGGFGGKEFTPVSTSRLILGGGGGAGTTNNSSTYPPANDSGSNQGLNSSGAAGGGMVIIRTNTVSGTGTISANGDSTLDVTRDGGGGGGAGGTVFVTTKVGSLAGLTVSVHGGKGGNAVFAQAHGPGGGGGGGVIVSNAPPNSVTVALGGLDGGLSGRTGSTMALPFDSEAGTGLTIPLVAGQVPGIPSGSECLPQLSIIKTTSTPNINQQATGTTATYTITVSNAANKTDATNVSISDQLPTGFTYASHSSAVFTGGATQTATVNPTVGSNNPTWGEFKIPGGGRVQITFVVNVANTVAAGTYQNPATASYTDPTGTKTVNYNSASSTGEDVTVSVTPPPKLLLVKRITRINNQDLNDIVDGRSDVPTTATNYVAAPRDTDDNDSKWPTNYLRGLINAGTVKPGDKLEYSVYFLSNGQSNVTQFQFCDLVPSNVTFVSAAFNGLIPNDGGLANADQGIALAVGSNNPTVYLSNVADSDRATFYPANDPNTPNLCNSIGSNTNGALVVDITRNPTLPVLPFATASGTPPESYGFVRFRGKVK